MPKLILLDQLEYLNIPYFAMPVASSRENELTRLDPSSLSKMVGRRCAAWVIEHRDQIHFIKTRNYIPPKTACYAHWLAFRDDSLAAAFPADWPRYILKSKAKICE